MRNTPDRSLQLVVAIAFGALTALLHAGQSKPEPHGAWTPENVSSPAGANSSAPQLTVDGNRTLLSWMESNGKHSTVKFAERTPIGWSEPRVVAEGDDLVVNSADVPSVRALADGTLAAAWLQSNSPDPEAYDLRLAWSHDAGKTWTPPVSPHHDGTKTQHGFASLFQAPTAGVGVVWLDGRATHGDEGNMSLRSAVFGTDGKQRSELSVDARVCECCPTAIAVTADGPIVAYRNRSPQEIRDIYVSRLAAGRWTMPVAVHRDGWRIEACPVNGPSISARGREVAVAWFTAVKDEGRAFLAFSHDGGRAFGPPVRLDEKGSLGRVAVDLLEDGAAAVGWVEFGEDRSQFKVRRVDASGARSPAVAVADISGTRYPRLARAGGELLMAWTESENGSSRVRTSRISLQ